MELYNATKGIGEDKNIQLNVNGDSRPPLTVSANISGIPEYINRFHLENRDYFPTRTSDNNTANEYNADSNGRMK